MLTDLEYAQLRMTDECRAPCPMPPMVFSTWRWFWRGATWDNHSDAFPRMEAEYKRQALDYLYSVFPGLYVLSSAAQAYTWGMLAIDQLLAEAGG